MRAFLKQLIKRHSAYQRTFLGDDGKPHMDAAIVLADLKRFCHVERPTYKVSPVTGAIDPVAMAAAEGRREVFMRVAQMMKLDEETIERLKEVPEQDD